MELERKELEAMAASNNGVVTVDMVIDAAKDEASPLHSHFEWDNDKAAENYRRWQARALIARCKITIASSEGVEVRAFVSLTQDRTSGGGYRMTTDVIGDDDLSAELLLDMERTIAAWKIRASLMSKSVFAAVSGLEEAVISARGSGFENREAA